MRVSVNFDGNIEMGWSETLTVHCSLQVEQFPFDKQMCNISFVSWNYDSSEMVISEYRDVGIMMYKDNPGEIVNNII
jgi:hypothetical protein